MLILGIKWKSSNNIRIYYYKLYKYIKRSFMEIINKRIVNSTLVIYLHLKLKINLILNFKIAFNIKINFRMGDEDE